MARIIRSLAEAHDYVSRFSGAPTGALVAMTGAGISTESGVPDFRSANGLWSRYTPVEFDAFLRSSESRLMDWQHRFEMADVFAKAEPNPAHIALAGLCASGQMSVLITQNVDGLHRRAGVLDDRLIELHGNSTYAKCLDCGRKAAVEDQKQTVAEGSSPQCSACGGLLKAAVISFGQQMPALEFERAVAACQACSVFIVLGSSLQVNPAAQLPVHAVRCGAELVILNAEETPLDALASTVVRTSLAETFDGFSINLT